MISVNWLRELAPGLEGDPRSLAERLSMTAVDVEKVIPVGGGLEEIRVARVREVRPHPNADRLTVCRVEAGAEPVDVVCGAPNVEAGALYPYVPPGARLPGGMEIEAREIRGELSRGMLCSEKELGLGPRADGILPLPSDLEPGTALAPALGFPDARLLLDLTPNRVDLACHLGVGRELAAGGVEGIVLRDFGGPGWEPRWRDGELSAEAGGVSVTLEDPDRCPRYLGAIVHGVSIAPSPAWLAGRLRAVGGRPVNNVVDATNYILHERNQPIHAFDLERLDGPEVRVRAAGAGEGLRTLDGEDRELSPAVTVIADARRPVGLAGVMGGEESEVTEGTTDLFIECAHFDPGWIRRTARESELATEASYRFERGIDAGGLEDALVRCVELILATAGGEADTPALRVGRAAPQPPVVALRRGRVKQVLGIDLDGGALRRLLAPLGFEAAGEDSSAPGGEESAAGAAGTGGSGGHASAAGEADVLAFVVPGWRGDVTREIDLVEEVARRHGYEEFPSERSAFRPTTVPDDPAWARADRARRLLEARGLLEARSSSLAGREEADPSRAVRLLNPLSEEEAYLRGALVPVLLRRLEHNFARGTEDVRLYEIGSVFREAGRERTRPFERYAEEMRIGALLTGRRRPEHWSGETPLLDLWDLKGLASEIATRLCGARLEPIAGGEAERTPGRFGSAGWLGGERFRMMREEELVGVAGGVRPEAVDAPPGAGPVWALELRLDAVRTGERPRYRERSAFPPVHRDLAFTVPRRVTAADAEAAIREAAPAFLEALGLFDVYRGSGIEPGRRSLAYRFRFRAPDRTLEDGEADRAMERIIATLEGKWDARIRSS